MFKASFAVKDAADELALVADIGGTNARFALAPLDGQGGLIEERKLRVRDFPTLADAADSYIQDVVPGNRPRLGVVAVAAPANRDEIRMTNSDWHFSVTQTRDRLGFDHLQVINDFAANSWAILDLDSSHLLQLGDKDLGRTGQGTYATLGPGTGLGVGAVRREADGQLTVVETEGGHIDFAPVSEEEDDLLRALRKRFGRVSYERLLCGTGLVNIYEALTGREGTVTPEDITERAAAGDPDARRAVDHFCEILGSFAGNVALMHGAWNGVFLSGCMLRAMADALVAGNFRQRFELKGRFSDLVGEIPTMLVQDSSLGLLGSAAALRARLNAQ